MFGKVINPYLTGVLQHRQSIQMREGMLHIRDVEGPKKTRSVETRLEAMEQQVFKCQGMVERGLNANHMLITEFTSKHKVDANDIGKHLSRLYDRIDQLQGQIYDLQNQNSRVTPTPPSRMPEDEALDSVSEEEPTVEVEKEVWEYVKPSEEAKVYVCNLPYNVSSECLAQLLGQAGVVQVSMGEQICADLVM
ncbi:40S ribosomal protein S5-1 [Hordeum vulgare]|nr:40S ribosomal protein S5-1 [Hordeum vulgare]